MDMNRNSVGGQTHDLGHRILGADIADRRRGALTNPTWPVSTIQVKATPVTHARSFKTATAGTIKTITSVVSGARLRGASAIAKNHGIGAGTVARGPNTISYAVMSAVPVPVGILIYIEFFGRTTAITPLVSGQRPGRGR
jgi:hypothetical protein